MTAPTGSPTTCRCCSAPPLRSARNDLLVLPETPTVQGRDPAPGARKVIFNQNHFYTFAAGTPGEDFPGWSPAPATLGGVRGEPRRAGRRAARPAGERGAQPGGRRAVRPRRDRAAPGELVPQEAAAGGLTAEAAAGRRATALGGGSGGTGPGPTGGGGRHPGELGGLHRSRAHRELRSAGRRGAGVGLSRGRATTAAAATSCSRHLVPGGSRTSDRC